MTRLSSALALLVTLAVLVVGCGGGDDSADKPAVPTGEGTRVAKLEAPPPPSDGSYKPTGQIVADSGFRPERDGFAFENYGPGYQELGPAEVEELFGPKVCASRNGDECVLTPPAAAWMAKMNKDASGGHCYGLSLMSLKMFDKIVSPLDWGAPAIRQLTLPGNVALQSEIAQSWAVQITPRVLLSDTIGTPNQILDKLTAGLKTHPDTYTTLIFRRDWTGGHAITPYAVEDKGGGQFAVLIYDNNYPGITRAIEFDRNKNTWSYEASTNPQQQSYLYEGDAQTQTIALSPTSATIGLQPCPFCPPPLPSNPAPQVRVPKLEGGSREIRVPAYEMVSLSGDEVNHGHLLLTDDQGRRTGYVGKKFVREIPGVLARPVFTNQNYRLEAEPTDVVPRGLKYTISLNGSEVKGADAEAVSVVGQGYNAQVSGIDVREGERHSLSIRGSGTKLVYRAPERNAKSPDIELGFDRRGADPTFAVATHKLKAGATLTASVNPDTDKLLLGGRGTAGGRAILNFSSIRPSGRTTTKQESLALRGSVRCDARSGRCRR